MISFSRVQLLIQYVCNCPTSVSARMLKQRWGGGGEGFPHSIYFGGEMINFNLASCTKYQELLREILPERKYFCSAFWINFWNRSIARPNVNIESNAKTDGNFGCYSRNVTLIILSFRFSSSIYGSLL